MTHDQRQSCTAVLGTLTLAMKAQRALAKQAVKANVVKVSRKSSEKGCIYGIEYDCYLSGNANAILDDAGIEIKDFFR